jgi:inner membrane protein
MHIAWWYWICMGLFLLLYEAMTPGGFFLLFIGIAAIIVGVLALSVHTAWIQVTLFAVLSAVLIVTLRKPMVERVRRTTQQADKPELIGETARAIEMIGAGKHGKIELRGSIWHARNSDDSDLLENAACIIIAREGIQLVVKHKQ